MFTVDEKSLKEYICWNLHSVLENICLTTECSHILTCKLPHWESINVLQQFSLRDIVLGFDIQKIGCFFLDYFMINVQSLHKNIKAVGQRMDTLLAVEDVGDCRKAWKARGDFPAPSLNTIVGTSVFQCSLSPEAWPFSSCPFKSFYLLYLCFLMSWLILPGSETYWQGACFYLCPQRMLTNWKKAPENTTSPARNITTASACTASASTPSTRRSRPAGNAHLHLGKVWGEHRGPQMLGLGRARDAVRPEWVISSQTGLCLSHPHKPHQGPVKCVCLAHPSAV